MFQVPAFCDGCGTVFSSGMAMGLGSTVTLVGNKAGPCPVCGGLGSIPDGVFQFTDNVVRVLSAPNKTLVQLQRLASVIAEARNTVTEPNKAIEKIEREAPELSSIASLLPKTRNELYAFLSLILAAVAIAITVANSTSDKSPTEADINRMIERTIERTYQEHKMTEQQRPQKSQPKQGRNEACLCGSGLKYKRCCGQFI